MNHWSEYPFVRILFAFLAGLVVCLYTPVHLPAWLLAILIFAVILIHVSIRNKTVRLYKHGALIGCCFQLTAFVFGNVLTAHKIDAYNPQHFIYAKSKADYFVIKITEPPVKKEQSYKVFASIIAYSNSGLMVSSFGKSILYLQKDIRASQLQYGNVLLVKNTFQPIARAANPGQFDYRKYLWYKEIYATAFLKQEDWHVMPFQSANPLFQFTYRLRDFSINALQSSIPSVREAAVVEALVIGFRDHMSFETKQSYTAAGVVHVLAVSGLHVAIVFALLHQLLFFLNRKKHGKLIQSIIILLLIWIFTMVTGLSGSVVRASTMFSFITIGKNMTRPVNMFNILSCSAMTILLIDPLLVMDVGFQLSYLAVFGIGTLNRYIDNWLPRENKIVDYLWKMVAMSLAAQLATLPLTTFYFHQFPTYFLLANIVVIPAAGILLHLGIALIAIHFITPLATFSGMLLEQITYAMNEFIENIQQLPSATLSLPEINIVQLLLLGLLIIYSSFFFISSRKKWLFAGVACLLVIIGIHCFNACIKLQEKTITLYSFKGISALEFKSRNTAQLFKSRGELSLSDSIYLQQHWKLNNMLSDLKQDQKNSMLTNLNPEPFSEGIFFQFYQYKLVVINQQMVSRSDSKKMKVDAVFISGNPPLHLRDVMLCFESAIIIFDSTNSRNRISKWKKEAMELGVITYDVSAEGAFVQHI